MRHICYQAMTVFYHYTSLRNLRGIIHSGWIEKGRLATVSGDVQNAAVNLTTDQDPAGHGLPDGRGISDTVAADMASTGNPGAYFCLDHTKCRLAVDIAEDDQMLIRAAKHHAMEDGVLYALEVAAWFPTKQSMDVAEMVEMHELIDSGFYQNKSPTWWYYFDHISIDRVLRVEINSEHCWFGSTVAEAKANIR